MTNDITPLLCRIGWHRWLRWSEAMQAWKELTNDPD